MNSRLEQIIAEIEEYIDSCKSSTFSKGKIVVDKEELMELLTELRLKTPEEIKRYQKIIANKDAILSDAQAKADEIIAQAQIQTNELVSEHQIMQQAYAQANEVVSIATNQAQEILDKMLDLACQGLLYWLEEGTVPAMNKFNSYNLTPQPKQEEEKAGEKPRQG